jgi:hypothetical protein
MLALSSDVHTIPTVWLNRAIYKHVHPVVAGCATEKPAAPRIMVDLAADSNSDAEDATAPHEVHPCIMYLTCAMGCMMNVGVISNATRTYTSHTNMFYSTSLW